MHILSNDDLAFLFSSLPRTLQLCFSIRKSWTRSAVMLALIQASDAFTEWRPRGKPALIFALASTRSMLTERALSDASTLYTIMHDALEQDDSLHPRSFPRDPMSLVSIALQWRVDKLEFDRSPHEIQIVNYVDYARLTHRNPSSHVNNIGSSSNVIF